MVLNANDVLKNGVQKKHARLKIVANILHLEHYLRWNGVASSMRFVKYFHEI